MYKALFVSFILLLKIFPALAQQDWKLNTDNDGIKIYTSLVSGSKIKAVKVECDFQATLSQFITVLLDVKNSPQWLYHTKSCTLIKQISPSELYYYSEVNLPWPAQNRDFVCHIMVSQNPATREVILNGPAIPGFIPEKNGIVRVENSSSQWIISPLANNKISVKYTLHVDPGGALPAWLVNMFGTEGPLQIFRNLKLQLRKPLYKNAVLPFITN